MGPMTRSLREFAEYSGVFRQVHSAESVWALPLDVCVHDLFERQAARHPDAVAVTSPTGSLTYADLDFQASQWARCLRGLGVRPDVLVGVCMERTPALIAALLAVSKAGGAFVPLDPDYPAERLRFMLEDSAAAVLLTESAQVGRLPSVDSAVLILDAPDPAGQLAPLASGTGEMAAAGTTGDLAYVIYTSGSTGQPKGVMIEHRGLMNYLSGVAADVLPAGPVVSLLHSSLCFDFSFTGLFLPLVTGGTLHLAPPRVPHEELAKIIQDPGFSLVRLTPSHIEVLISALEGKSGLVGPGVFLVGGEVLRAHHVTALRRLFPKTAVYNHYGPAEAVIGRCVMPLTEAAGFDLARYQPHDPLPIGRPLPGTDILVAYETKDEEANRTGELLIGGTGLARGYLGRAEETRQRFRYLDGTQERVYRSGDVVTFDEDGLLIVAGRIDDQVKVRGHRVELPEVEGHIAALPDVRAVAVVSTPPPREGLTAFVVSDRQPPPEPAALRAALARTVPPFMVPNRIVYVSELPLSGSRKLDRVALRRLAQQEPEAHQAAGAGRAPANDNVPAAAVPILDAVCRIWAEVLDLPVVLPEDNFLALGGDSIRAIKVVARCRRLGLDATSRGILLAEDVREFVDSARKKPRSVV
jgi:amino acid adenylation domain-containing protein